MVANKTGGSSSIAFRCTFSFITLVTMLLPLFVDANQNRVSKIVHFGSASCALLQDSGALKCWGEFVTNTGNQLPLGVAPEDMGNSLPYLFPQGGSVTDLAGAYSPQLCVIHEGITKCWTSYQRLLIDTPLLVDFGGATRQIDKLFSAAGIEICGRVKTAHSKLICFDEDVLLAAPAFSMSDGARAVNLSTLPSIDFWSDGEEETEYEVGPTLSEDFSVAHLNSLTLQQLEFGSCVILASHRVKCFDIPSKTIMSGTFLGSPSPIKVKSVTVYRTRTLLFVDFHTSQLKWIPGNGGAASLALGLDHSSIFSGRYEQVFAGGNVICVTSVNNTALACANSYASEGQAGTLGLGLDGPGMSLQDLTRPIDLGLAEEETIVDVSIQGREGESICTLTSLGQVKCFGANSYGLLGVGIADTAMIIGDEPGEMGANLRPIVFSSCDYGSFEIVHEQEVATADIREWTMNVSMAPPLPTLFANCTNNTHRFMYPFQELLFRDEGPRSVYEFDLDANGLAEIHPSMLLSCALFSSTEVPYRYLSFIAPESSVYRFAMKSDAEHFLDGAIVFRSSSSCLNDDSMMTPWECQRTFQVGLGDYYLHRGVRYYFAIPNSQRARLVSTLLIQTTLQDLGYYDEVSSLSKVYLETSFALTRFIPTCGVFDYGSSTTMSSRTILLRPQTSGFYRISGTNLAEDGLDSVPVNRIAILIRPALQSHIVLAPVNCLALPSLVEAYLLADQPYLIDLYGGGPMDMKIESTTRSLDQNLTCQSCPERLGSSTRTRFSRSIEACQGKEMKFVSPQLIPIVLGSQVTVSVSLIIGPTTSPIVLATPTELDLPSFVAKVTVNIPPNRPGLITQNGFTFPASPDRSRIAQLEIMLLTAYMDASKQFVHEAIPFIWWRKVEGRNSSLGIILPVHLELVPNLVLSPGQISVSFERGVLYGDDTSHPINPKLEIVLVNSLASTTLAYEAFIGCDPNLMEPRANHPEYLPARIDNINSIGDHDFDAFGNSISSGTSQTFRFSQVGFGLETTFTKRYRSCEDIERDRALITPQVNISCRILHADDEVQNMTFDFNGINVLLVPEARNWTVIDPAEDLTVFIYRLLTPLGNLSDVVDHHVSRRSRRMESVFSSQFGRMISPPGPFSVYYVRLINLEQPTFYIVRQQLSGNSQVASTTTTNLQQALTAQTFRECLTVHVILETNRGVRKFTLQSLLDFEITSPCPKGTASPTGSTSSVCQLCSIGMYQDSTGQTNCFQCPEETPLTRKDGAITINACQAPVGSFVNLAGKAVPCPKSSNCSESGITLASLPLLPGFWRTGRTSSEIIPCNHAYYCKGGRFASVDEDDATNYFTPTSSAVISLVSNGSDLLCIENHMGILCESCVPGTAKQGPLNLCAPCTSDQTFNDSGRIAGIAIGCIFGLFGAFLLFLQIWKWMEPCLVKGGGDSTAKAYNALIDVGIKFRIVIGLFQVLASVSITFANALPVFFVNLANLFYIFSLDIVALFGFGCSIQSNFFSSLLLSTLVPPLLCALVWLFHYLIIERRLLKQLVHKERDLPMWRNIAWTTSLIILFIAYPTMCRRILATFHCIDFDDGSRVLSSDPSISCTSEQYLQFYIYSVFMILLEVIGIPLFQFALLYGQRNALTDDHDDDENNKEQQQPEVQRLRFLWRPYRATHYYFEIVEMIRKVLQTSVIVFVKNGTTIQMIYEAMITIAFVTLVHSILPYRKLDNSILAIASLWAIFFITFITLLIKIDAERPEENEEYDENLLTSLLIFFVAIVPCAAFIQVLAEFDVFSSMKRRSLIWLFTKRVGRRATLGGGNVTNGADNHATPIRTTSVVVAAVPGTDV